MHNHTITLGQGISDGNDADFVKKFRNILFENPICGTEQINVIAKTLELGFVDFTARYEEKSKESGGTTTHEVGVDLIQMLARIAIVPGEFVGASADMPDYNMALGNSYVVSFDKQESLELLEYEKKMRAHVDEKILSVLKLYLAAGLTLKEQPNMSDSSLDPIGLDEGIAKAVLQKFPKTTACIKQFMEDGIRPTKEELAKRGINFDPEKRRNAVREYHQKKIDNQLCADATEMEKIRQQRGVFLNENALYAADILPDVSLSAPYKYGGKTVYPDTQVKVV